MKCDNDYLAIALQVFTNEIEAVREVADRLDFCFERAVRKILDSSSRVIVCGMGKSGIIGRKIAATLSSTGTPSFFMHPGEAYHGDLGMVIPDDIFLAISNSGETEEILRLIPFLKDNGNFLISFSGNDKSTLAINSDVHIDVSVSSEACRLNLAPTSSTTATLVMGDALAVALMAGRDFQPANFARFHPGGSLGRRLLSRVDDSMVADSLPIVKTKSDFLTVLEVMAQAGLGLVVVEIPDGRYGIITDGDIRRSVTDFKRDVFNLTANDIMVSQPTMIRIGSSVGDALDLMQAKRVNSLLVVDENVRLLGVFRR